MDNDEYTYNHLRELVAAAKLEGNKDHDVWTKEEATLYTLEGYIKEFVEELTDNSNNWSEASMGTDLLAWAIEQINFREIAESLLEE